MPKKQAAKQVIVAKKIRKPFARIVNAILWVTGVIVAFAVGFAMTKGGALYNSIPAIPPMITGIAGWVVIVLVVLGVIMAIIDALS